MREFISPKEFSKKVNLSYDHVLRLCKLDEIETVKTQGGHFRIPLREVDRFIKPQQEYITRADYEAVVRENERLRLQLEQIRALSSIGD